jgi:hypothetical protein
VDGRKRNDAVLQVDDDKSGRRINRGDGHGARFRMIWTGREATFKIPPGA